jgi:hypothetical protein
LTLSYTSNNRTKYSHFRLDQRAINEQITAAVTIMVDRSPKWPILMQYFYIRLKP